MLFEQYTQLLLVAHAILALATVALSTHLVFWLRPFLRGKYARRKSVVRFAALSAGAYLFTMLIGLALYPTYRVRVRAEYLENPSAIARDMTLRAEARIVAQKRNAESRAYRRGEERPEFHMEVDSEHLAHQINQSIERGIKVSRWFDVKEHWSAMGLLMSIAVLCILLGWKPDRERKGIRYVVFGLATATAFTAWAAAIIGLLTAAARSVAVL